MLIVRWPCSPRTRTHHLPFGTPAAAAVVAALRLFIYPVVQQYRFRNFTKCKSHMTFLASEHANQMVGTKCSQNTGLWPPVSFRLSVALSILFPFRCAWVLLFVVRFFVASVVHAQLTDAHTFFRTAIIWTVPFEEHLSSSKTVTFHPILKSFRTISLVRKSNELMQKSTFTS